MNKYLISVVGATGIGKTAMSIHIANHFNAPIISCDSRQFYREMTIGTAVPSKEELENAKHYFIQNRSITDNYSVGDYERDALELLEKLYNKHNVVVLVGGSGLYADAVLKGLDSFPPVSADIREELKALLVSDGIEVLQEKLKQLDPVSYSSIAIDNPHRLIRALEICIGTGKSYSSFKNKNKQPRPFTSIKIGLTAAREIMYDRINDRVDIMMESGLLEEVKKLFKYRDLNALQTVGYKELFSYLDGDIDLEFAISEIKKNTRRFAKRQVTWNKKDTEIHWFEHIDSHDEINALLESLIVQE